MFPRKSRRGVLQQQTPRERDPQQQQQAGSDENQPKPGAQQREQQMGEGSYEGTRDYQERTKEYLKKGDVQKDAEAAKPRSEEEARDLKEAEDEGRSHSKGER